ncbi:hypothetical protein T492DRAFT_1023698 [Pavlovales sp. CCMP2436]|nr:hypothetical protein T492DRAFT_1023698 [Pavlovales sp. CCMP2436]
MGGLRWRWLPLAVTLATVGLVALARQPFLLCNNYPRRAQTRRGFRPSSALPSARGRANRPTCSVRLSPSRSPSQHSVESSFGRVVGWGVLAELRRARFGFFRNAPRLIHIDI